MSSEEEAIPWKLSSKSHDVPLWLWETEVFTAIIQTDENRVRFFWDVIDYSGNGRGTLLAQGLTGSFRESEDFVKEIVGKSYHRSLGFLKYAGSQATTYKIFNGDKIDFGPLVSKKVTLMVRVVDGNNKVKEKRYVGRLSLENYKIKLSPEHGDTVKIPPSRITKVSLEFGGEIKPVVREDKIGKSIRTYDGVMKTGCTGKPGFMHNTVEHGINDPRCPVHEQ